MDPNHLYAPAARQDRRAPLERGLQAASPPENKGAATCAARDGLLGLKRRKRRAPLMATALFLGLTLLAGAGSARAEDLTNTTFEALAAAVAQGGLVTFPQDATITFTNTLVITNQVQLEANGHAVTLTGNNAVRLFQVFTPRGASPSSLELNGLTLTGGRSTNGGALFVDANAAATLTNCILGGNGAGSMLVDIPNQVQTNSFALVTNFTFNLQVATNFSTNFFVLDPTFTFNMSISFVSTLTSLHSNNVSSIGILTPTNSANVGKTSFRTNQTVFTNVLSSTNFTLLTNAYGTIVGTNIFANTSTIIETDTAYITNTGIPMVHIVPAPGSDGKDGSDSSFGRGSSGGDGRAGSVALGGAIYNRGTLALLNCLLVTNNANGGDGGNGGNGGNGAFKGGNGGKGGKGGNAFGGALYNDKTGRLLIQNCTFDHNRAASGSGGTGGEPGSGVPTGLAGNGGAAGLAYGGALYNLGLVTNLASTFSANSATGGDSAAAGTAGAGGGNSGPRGGDAFGGAIYNAAGTNRFTNCTFFANAATGGAGGDGGPGQGRAGKGGNGGNAAGGALFNAKNASFLVNCTLWQNSAEGGTNGVAGSGAFENSKGSPGASRGGNLARGAGTLLVANSISGATASGRNAYGKITDKGFNLWSDKSVSLTKKSSSTNGVNPGLGSFGAFGGPTRTISLATNSLALGFVPPTNTPVVDQRGVSRPQGTDGFIDAGAVEQGPGAPVLLASPQSQTQTNGGNATFRVSAAGTELSYQWRFNGTNLAGLTASSVTFTNLTVFGTPTLTTNTPITVGYYDVIITNGYGALTSAPPAALTIWVCPPAITLQPTNRLAALGGTAGFVVAATGGLPLSYQWFFNGTNPIAGANSSRLLLTNVSAAHLGSYSVLITNLYGALTSTQAVLSLGVPPTISAQPAPQVVPQGSNATFTVTAQGSPPLLYQWQFNSNNLSAGWGMDLATYTIADAQPTNDGPYTVVVSNPFGSITSAPASLRVLTAPLITTNPLGRTVLVGSNVTFTVAALGREPLSYQWQWHGTNLGACGTNLTTYTVTNAQLADAGPYSVLVSDSANASVLSEPAVLTVLAPVSLSGRLTALGTTVGLAGMTVLLTNQTLVLSTNTDAAGYYAFTNLWPGSANTVLPVGACQRFEPPFAHVLLGTTNTSAVNFGGTTNVFTLQGRIADGLTGISGVSVQVTNQGGSQTLTSDSGGYYGCSFLCPGTYQVTPAAPGYQFVPATLPVTVGPTDAFQVNFAAIPLYTLSGRIVEDAGSNGLAGVTVLINSTNSVQTDTNGDFSRPNLPAGNYTLTPLLNCYRFSPSAALVSVGAAGPNQTNFLATASAYQLGGRLTADTNGLDGFTVKLVSVGATGPNQTNFVTTTNGYYLFAHVCPGTNIIEPQPFGAFRFSPLSRTVVTGPDFTDQDFQAYGAYSASGRITLLATNPLPGVTVAAVGTNSASATTTDAEGTFRLLALSPGTQDIVPALAGYQFVPASRRLALAADTNSVDFAALPLLSLASPGGAPAQVSFPALPGLTYTLTASTNLLDWLTLCTTNLDATNLAASIVFQDVGSTQFPARYYRLGPAAADTNRPAPTLLPAGAR